MENTTEVKVLSKEYIEYSRGFAKTRYHIQLGEKIYWVLDWNDLDYPIVYDNNIHSEVSKINWTFFKTYAQHKELGYLHHMVMKLNNVQKTQDTDTVDHIDEFKLDNRFDNLRYVSQSIQNSNRGSRGDKTPPLDELKAIGVEEYPRFVRWEKTEKKFVIEKHPILNKEVAEGKRKKALVSGTKSEKKTIVEKYQDIMARLKDLDDMHYGQAETDFINKKNKLRNEYIAICKAIKGIVHVAPETVKQPDTVQLKRSTAPNRKTESKLPEDCGISIEMMPKYTHYAPAKGNRGDKFSIEVDGYRWSTCGSQKVKTKEKFEELMKHIDALSDDIKTKMGV
jgi:hypothetical protein